LEKLKGKDHSEDLDTDGRILKWILEKWGVRYELVASGSEQGPVMGPAGHSDEPSGTIKSGEFLDYLSDYQLLKKEFAPWS
jgi:hypothetical protein